MQPERYYIIHKKVARAIFIALGVSAIAFLLIWVYLPDKPGSCKEFAAQGKVNIQYGDSDYNPALDRDKNRVACQA